MITIIADESTGHVGQELFRALSEKGGRADYVSLEGVNVKPCMNCAGCTYTTFGKCVVRDDADWILPKIIRSDAFVFVTPITYGGYSFSSKQVLDKLALIADRNYHAHERELVKGGFPGRSFVFYAIGVSDNCPPEEADVFKRLHRETVWITHGRGKAFVIASDPDSTELTNIANEVTGK